MSRSDEGLHWIYCELRRIITFSFAVRRDQPLKLKNLIYFKFKIQVSKGKMAMLATNAPPSGIF